MTRIEAIIQPSRFESVKEALQEMGVEAMTVTEVRGQYWPRQKEPYRELSWPRSMKSTLLPKIKIRNGRLVPTISSMGLYKRFSGPRRPAKSATERSLFPKWKKPSASVTRNAEKPRSSELPPALGPAPTRSSLRTAPFSPSFSDNFRSPSDIQDVNTLTNNCPYPTMLLDADIVSAPGRSACVRWPASRRHAFGHPPDSQ